MIWWSFHRAVQMQHCCFRGCCAKIFLQLPSPWFSFPSSSVPRVSPWVLVWINLNSCHYFHIRQLSWVETGDKRKIFRGQTTCIPLLYPKVPFQHTEILGFILLFVKQIELFGISLRYAKILDIPRGCPVSLDMVFTFAIYQPKPVSYHTN